MFVKIPWYFHLLPYCIAERRIRDLQGASAYLQWIDDDGIPNHRFKYWLPHFHVARKLAKKEERRRAREEREKAGQAARPRSVPVSGFRHGAPETAGRGDFPAALGEVRCPQARILVFLHLYYPDMWPVIRRYLEHLAPYAVKLVVTYPEGLIPEHVLAAVRAFRAGTILHPCRNAGFDIGPFVDALRRVDLADYDVVFKLQTKGSHRDSLTMYGQVFKHEDWFFNLYDGILGGASVHHTIAALVSNEAALAAAANLVVGDPKHKRTLVREACAARGLNFVDDYQFVAGTCFAARSEVLAPIKACGFTLADFEDTARGTFSLAHVLERWMCFAAAGHFLRVETPHATYPEEVRAFSEQSAYPLLEDPRFEVDADFFYRRFEFVRISGYEIVEIRLGDIRRVWFDHRAYRLDECSVYRYLMGDVKAYEAYCRENAARSGFAMDAKRFDALRQSMKTFDERHLPIVFGAENVILDGQHRCCILLKEHGPDFRVRVVRIFPPRKDPS